MLTRRAALLGLGAALAPLPPRRADAGVARALPLPTLVAASRHVVIGRAVEAWSRWETVARRRRIVTWHRLAVDERVAREAAGAELMVRTLGGQVDGVGQHVHGEAVVALGERAVVFLAELPDGALGVTALAQGHYPLVTSGKHERLAANPGLGALVGDDERAARRLVGHTREDAVLLIRRAEAR